MSGDLVTIAHFNAPSWADLVRSRLEAAGIEAFLPDEGLAQTAQVYLAGAGGYRVQVRDEDEARARAVVAQSLGESDEVDEAEVSFAWDDDAGADLAPDEEGAVDPQAKRRENAQVGIKLLIAAAFLLAAIVLLRIL
jgi:hypothetical protein